MEPAYFDFAQKYANNQTWNGTYILDDPQGYIKCNWPEQRANYDGETRQNSNQLRPSEIAIFEAGGASRFWKQKRLRIVR
jgi:hypothetical protein